ncbi:MAG: response regulator, partial [Synechococcales cyanobacterium RM1_1_8]|nr:response regulator [Synechococcales cyanobacterium RM1_1_8]
LTALAKVPLAQAASLAQNQPAQNQPAQNQPAPRMVPSPQAPLIVCIDNSRQVREQMGQVLTAHGYRYQSIASSVEALQKILEMRPALIFIDLIMPQISGYELCSQIRRVSRLQNIPLIILTSSDTVLDRLRGKLAGASEYLTKPATPDQIVHAAARWLAAAV